MHMIYGMASSRTVVAQGLSANVLQMIFYLFRQPSLLSVQETSAVGRYAATLTPHLEQERLTVDFEMHWQRKKRTKKTRISYESRITAHPPNRRKQHPRLNIGYISLEVTVYMRVERVGRMVRSRTFKQHQSIAVFSSQRKMTYPAGALKSICDGHLSLDRAGMYTPMLSGFRIRYSTLQLVVFPNEKRRI
jgi:hypothetical protein